VSQRQGVNNFKHAVSRFIKIAREGRYCKPIGFTKHSDYGANQEAHRINQEKIWQQAKEQEMNQNVIPIQFQQTQDETDKLNNQAKEIINKIMELEKIPKLPSTENAIYCMRQALQQQLERLIEKGAQQNAIQNYVAEISNMSMVVNW
jgi:hypothetical protein